jgi:hypothetical protein
MLLWTRLFLYRTSRGESEALMLPPCTTRGEPCIRTMVIVDCISSIGKTLIDNRRTKSTNRRDKLLHWSLTSHVRFLRLSILCIRKWRKVEYHFGSSRVCSVATPELIWRSNLNLTRSFGDSDDFSIWNSSRSAVASNLHALLYEVVVLELLAPDQSWGLDLYLQIQNQPGALRDDAFVKYGDSTCVRDPHIAPARYIWRPSSYSRHWSLPASARWAGRDTGDGVEGLNRLDWRPAGTGDPIVLRH